jgi:hypothetical protein
MNKNMEKKIVVLLIIVSLLAGFGIGAIFEKGSWDLSSKLAQGQEEIDSLKSQLEMVFPSLPEEVYYVSGVVTEVEDKFLVVEAMIQMSRFPSPEGKDYEMQNIKVNVTEGTEIFKVEMEESSSPLENPFKRIGLDLKNIEIGDNVMAVSEENIKGKKEITATEIEVMKI